MKRLPLFKKKRSSNVKRSLSAERRESWQRWPKWRTMCLHGNESAEIKRRSFISNRLRLVTVRKFLSRSSSTVAKSKHRLNWTSIYKSKFRPRLRLRKIWGMRIWSLSTINRAGFGKRTRARNKNWINKGQKLSRTLSLLNNKWVIDRRHSLNWHSIGNIR